MSNIKLSKQEKIELVRKAYQEVKEELGEYKHSISLKFITLRIQEKLPEEPIYDIRTIGQIITGHYK